METNLSGLQELQPGTTLCGGKYIIEKKIGEGGFSITYRAKQSSLNRPVCIKEYYLSGYCMRNPKGKTVHPVGGGAEKFSKYRTSFVDEAKTVAKLHHPSIVDVIDIFDENNTSYMVMTFIEGSNMQSIVEKSGPMAYPMAVNYMAQVADAVGYIHNNHILHRDIKPENIMITADYKAILIDFGSAREYEEDKTQAYTSLVTHGYAPPEQYARNSHVGAYTDIYALGATLYFILTGQVPMEAASRAITPMPTPKELNPELPNEANRTIMKAMQLKSQDRHQSINEFMDDLRNIKPSRPVRKGYGIYIIIAAVVLLAGLGVWWFLTHNNQESAEVKSIPSVEVYAQALSKMNSADTVTFMEGYRMMDSLSRIEYIPAMYEMVRTLGWNSNETSIRRKDMLGIEYDEDNSPVDSTINNAVLSIADRLLEIHDTTQANINMKVAYLMYFYCEGGKFKVSGDYNSQHYLDEAQHWAEFLGDTIFLNTIINTEKSNN